MKLTRRHLRKLILEAINEASKKYIVDPSGVAMGTRDAYDAGVKTISKHPAIAGMLEDPEEEVQRQALELGAASGLASDTESTALGMGREKAYRDDLGRPQELFHLGKEKLLDALYTETENSGIEITRVVSRKDLQDIANDPTSIYDEYADYSIEELPMLVHFKAEHYSGPHAGDVYLGDEHFVLELFPVDGFYGLGQLSGGPRELDDAGFKLSGNYKEDAKEIVMTMYQQLRHG